MNSTTRALFVLFSALFLMGALACGGRLSHDPQVPDGGGHPAVVVPAGGAASGAMGGAGGGQAVAKQVMGGRVAAVAPGGAADEDESADGLVMRLSEGGEPGVQRPDRPLAQAQPLTDAEVERLLARLPPLTEVEGDVVEFHFRPESLPPPLTGTTVEQSFPPPVGGGAAPTPAVLPLHVVRRAPEGELDLASHLAITFDQPMVPLTSVDAAATVQPLQLVPQPAGQWRWLDTVTLLFEPEGGRFPMATRYTATLPFGTTSARGARLDERVEFSFTTPAPRLVWSSPGRSGPSESVTETPVILAEFNQRIDPAAVLAHTRLRAGGRSWPLRLVGADELAGDPWVDDAARRHLAAAPAGTWLAFRCDQPLPLGSTAEVSFDRGTPSAEGPLTTEQVQSMQFKVHGALQLDDSWCGHPTADECRPGWSWGLTFSNALDAAAFTAEQVTVVPAVDDLQAWVSGSVLNLQGATRPDTDYQVFVDGTLRDVFGQTLGQTVGVSFEVGELRRPWPQLFMPDGSFHVLEPESNGSLIVHSINYDALDVAVYAVTADQWDDFAVAPDFWQQVNDGQSPAPPGRKVWSARLDLSDEHDELVGTGIDLTPAFGDSGFGHAIVMVTARDPDPRPDRWRPSTQYRWVQRGELSVDALIDATQLLAWVTDLADGEPRAGVEVQLQPDGVSAVTDASGLARFELTDSLSPPRSLVAGGAATGALLPERVWNWSWRRDQQSGWVARTELPRVLWHVLDDRGMYRPGETVHYKGWVRVQDEAVSGDIRGYPRLDRRVSWRAQDSQGNELATGDVPLDAFGGFEFALALPTTVNLGNVGVHFTLPDDAGEYSDESTWHHVQVQEFRRPEYEVTVSADAGPHLIGGSALATVQASYFAGGGLADAEVQWTATAQAGQFVPPGRDEFNFGDAAPWWWHGGWDQPESRSESLTARTDAAGTQHLAIDFLSGRPPRPWSVRVEAGVFDVNRQRWAGATSLLVHPSEVYVGLRSERSFVQAGQPLEVEFVAVDLDGAAVPGRQVALRAWRDAWKRVGGEWQTVEEDLQERTVSSGAEPLAVRFEGREGGRWTIQAETTDAAGRLNRSRLTMWVAGGGQPPARGVSQEQLTLIPDQASYQPGDVAQILVQAPFDSDTPAHGLLRLERAGLVEARRFDFDAQGSATLEVPITEAYIRNVHVSITAVGATVRTDDAGEPMPDAPPRPAFAAGQLVLEVPPRVRELSVAVTPRDAELVPGGETVVDVAVSDATGAPLTDGTVAVIVVDEAVLALSGYQLADPLESFYWHRGGDVRVHELRPFVLLAEPALPDLPDPPEEVQERGFLYKLFGGAERDASAPASAPVPSLMSRAKGALSGEAESQLVQLGYMDAADDFDGDGGGEPDQPVRERSNFDALALFAGAAVLGPDGTASVPVTLPDNLTRYRVMVVAVDRARLFGKGESSITARLPLMARPSAPRFLNYGDTFELPLVLQNGTDTDMVVELAARAANATLTAGAGRRVTVPARDRIEVRLPAAADRPGTARFQVLASADGSADAASFSFPVWTPATTEAFAVYGTLDAAGASGAVAQPVTRPPDVVPSFGGLEVTVSSTAVAELTDALLYLVDYPYGCAEQIASRVLSIAVLNDVLSAFEAEQLPDPDALRRSMAGDIARLAALQNPDGGFGYWRADGDSVPYLSVHVALALQTAAAHGHDVPKATLDRSRGYLTSIRQRFPEWYGEDLRRTVEAFALNVRWRLGDAATARARDLLAAAPLADQPLDRLGWLLPVLAADQSSGQQVTEILRHLGNRTSETAGAAHFTTQHSPYGNDGWVLLESERRTDGVVLDALISASPDSDLIVKLVRGLLAHRTRGRWGNTQENAFILLALKHYFDEFEALEPDFVARAWLGDDYALQAEYRGRDTRREHVMIPMAFVGQTPEDLVLSKDGPGRLYYRLGMRYAPSDLVLAAADRGFAVERRYSGVDDPADVWQSPDGTWNIKLGATVKVTVTMQATSVRTHVALVDPLPAGLETLNPALAVTGALPADDADDAPGASGRHGGWWWWNRPWFDHQNLRDERTEAFAAYVPAGVHTYSYFARATTPGVFQVPPPKAEEMYAPETFGRGASAVVVVD